MNVNLKKYERSLVCQFRSCILPLRIDIDRYIGKPVEQRICRLCPSNEVEDEKHFLLQCAVYTSFRTNIFGDILLSQDFFNLTNQNI
jgi:chemotaxis regulatin CheY-phosphate phosphatase CheZ